MSSIEHKNNNTTNYLSRSSETSNGKNNSKDNITDMMKIDYSYPDPSDPYFQYKIYKKREFYYHKIPKRPNIDNYDDIKEYRDNICARNFTLHEHQAMLSNFINPNTPYKGCLIFHGLGTGKCISKSSYCNVNNTYEKISSVWEKYQTLILNDNDGGEWSVPSTELIVNSLDNNKKFVRKKVLKLYREKVKTKLKKILLEDGNEIEITQIHKLLNQYGWNNDLNIGDAIAVPKKIHDYRKGICISHIEKELVQFMCHHIFNGIESDECITFPLSVINLEQIKILCDTISKKYDIQMNILLDDKNLIVKSQKYFDILYDNHCVIGKKLEKREIPHIIMNSSLDCIKDFLHIIFNPTNNDISSTFKIYSKQLLYQLDYLCKLTGYHLNFEVNENIYYCNISSSHFFNNKESDISYIKIKSIEYIDYDDYVYDLEIEDTHNYIANGIICHNTCAAISIAEKFKDMVQKYNTKIYVLVSGPLIRENWKNELLTCTGETYLKYQDKSVFVDDAEKQKVEKNAVNNALQYYRFMSYRSFYKRVLGEKIVDRKQVQGEKVKVSYRKTEEGEFERDIAVDRIYNLNNSIIIVDEAHNLTGNAYGEALKMIIKNSTNLRIVLLSATPMKNLADDIIELINFLRPLDSQIERDKIFTNNKIHLMDIKPGGLEYFKKMAQGYVSHVRGADPLIFAKRVDKGEKPEGLIFTKVIRCKMAPFQKKIYEEAIKLIQEDSLDRKSEAVANFAFPALSQDKKQIIGVYGREGINIVKNQIKSNYDQLNNKIASEIIKNKDESDLIYITEDGKTITGKFLQMRYLENFSTKFYRALKKLNRLVWGKKGAKTAFVYSNLVKVGIELFQEVLLQNGYLEYQENSTNYQIKSNTVCYFCGKTYAEHKNLKFSDRPHSLSNSKLSESSESFESSESSESSESDLDGHDDSSTDHTLYKNDKDMPLHEFRPATFIAVTGKSSEETAEFIPEDKQRILKTTYSNLDNKEGKFIKLVLGSKVMNEGISLRNVGEVHILDVYFNLGKVDQTVGRAIRQCSHYKLMDIKNKFPYVNVYKYVVSVDNGLSTEEELYKKAESKYMLIKKIERALKEIAIDCPLNVYGNMFNEEIEQYKNCGEPGKEMCPTICDYTKCDYKCDNAKLNSEYYDPNRKIYKKIKKDELDYSTFTNSLARNEIEYSKTKIKELYLNKYEYTLDDILNYIKNSYSEEKRDLFDEFFVYKALDELIPLTENDFNNYKDTILDKFNRQGYLIFRGKYYIFQPFDQNEDVPMYYRTSFDKQISQNLSLHNYLKSMDIYAKYKGTKTKISENVLIKNEPVAYNFDLTMDYYENRDEFKYVGIIDKELSRRKSKQLDEIKDVFKIREKREKVLDKKRGTGIPSLKGAVCSTSKNKEYLENIAKELDIKLDQNETRDNICNLIKEKMLHFEKYSTGKEKVTYVMIPYNHSLYEFPYNLEDRTEYIIDKLKSQIKHKVDISKKKEKNKQGNIYKIIITDTEKLKDYIELLKSLKAHKIKNEWIINVE